MNLKDSVILITGANRGLGKALAEAAVKAGARKVYGGARNPASITVPGVTPIKLDVTNAADIAAAAQAIPDLTVLVNNAGVFSGTDLTAPDALQVMQRELDTNFFGPMALSQAFAPALKNNGGGAIVNVISALAWISMPGTGTYSVSKSAQWALSNGLRVELHGQNTRVLAAHMGYMDTDMVSAIDAPKTAPAEVARIVFAALEAGDDEVLVDDITRQVKQGLGAARGMYLGAPLAA